MQMVFKGIITGIIIILPGMSGGPPLLCCKKTGGRLVPPADFALAALCCRRGRRDSRQRRGFSWLLESYTNYVSAFLLGCILASIRAVLVNIIAPITGGSFYFSWAPPSALFWRESP